MGRTDVPLQPAKHPAIEGAITIPDTITLRDDIHGRITRLSESVARGSRATC